MVTERIHLLRIDFQVQISPERSLPRFVYSLIVFGEAITVIDSGVKGSYRLIYDYIEQHNRDIGEIKTLILSHAHPDHIGSAKRIKMDTGCRVLGHALEKEWMEHIDAQYASRPVPGFYGLVDESVELDEVLTGGEVLELDKGMHLSIIHTPGHSKGSFSILFQEDSVLFTADSLPIANDIPTYDNFRDLMDSMKRIKSLKGYHTLLSSWAPPLKDQQGISDLLSEGEHYLRKIDQAVKEYYGPDESHALEHCGKVIHALGLPPVFIIPLVDRAFRTHGII